MSVTTRWMIYGANTVSGKKLISCALNSGSYPLLAGPDGQALVDLGFKTGLETCIFSVKEAKKFLFLLKQTSIFVLCQPLSHRLHRKVLKACLKSKVHYIDLSRELYIYENAMKFSARFRKAGLNLIPALHASNILCDLTASLLKSKIHDAKSLSLFCSESFLSIQSLRYDMMRGPRVFRNSKLSKPEGNMPVDLVNFQEGKSALAVISSQAEILCAWHSTRIPNICFFRSTTEREVRFLKFFQRIRWFFWLPFLSRLLFAQKSFFLRNFNIKASYPESFAICARVQNMKGDPLYVSIQYLQEMDIGSALCLETIEKITASKLKPGLLSPSQIFSPEDFLDESRFKIKYY